MRHSSSASTLAIACSMALMTPISADAQDDTSPEPDNVPDLPDSDDNTIFVFGARLLDSVDSPQPPILALEPEDVAAYGVGSIGELLEALGPSVSNGRGRGGGQPIVLVNGVRVASFRDIRSYPPESIDKVEVFSEETAQQYGYRPDQRVVNFILKKSYASTEIELGYSQPWDGGYFGREVEATYLRIDGSNRLNIQLDWEGRNTLTEAERGIIQTGDVPDLSTDPDPADFRTLRAPQEEYEATLNWTAPLDDSGSNVSLNATLEREDQKRLQGLDTVLLTGPDGNSVLRSFNAADPLTVDERTDEYALGASITTNLSGWRITGTLDASRNEDRSIIARDADTDAIVEDAAAGLLALDAPLDGLVPDAGEDIADKRTDAVTSLVTARGVIGELPAGDISLTLDGGYSWTRITSSDTRNNGEDTQLTRGDVNGGLNVSVPIAERGGFAGAIGDVTLNASGGIDHLSDFGTLYDWTLGVTWGVTDSFSFNANRFVREAPPGLGQLGNPEIATPNVPVFDLTNGETVLAEVITGGNPDLPAQMQRDWKFGLNYELPFIDQGRLTVDYIRNRTGDLSTSFPVLTPDIEAAFPDRVTRDATGRLIRLDDRPVSFAERFLERIEVSLNIRGNWGRNAAGRRGGRFGGRDDGGGRRGDAGGAGRDATAPAAPRGGGGPGAGRDPERMAQLRATFCEASQDELLERLNAAALAAARGEEPPLGPDGEPIRVPPRMLERLAAEDGTIDTERFAAMRTRICEGGANAQQTRQSVVAQSAPPAPRAPARGRFGPPGGDGGRWFANITYRYDLENTVMIAPGLAPLDLLDGDAISSTGEPVHFVQFRGGAFYKGFGTLFFGNYTGSSSLDGTGLPGSTDLFFNDIFKVNLRAFIDFNQQASVIEKVPFLENTRFILRLDNVFDARQSVTDADGATPLRYQPFLIDPVGRRFEIELRKIF